MTIFFRPQGRYVPKQSARTRLDLEALESREVPATFTVINTMDAGPGSLRQAIISANGTAGTDDIVLDSSFVAGTTINLTSGDLNINDSVNIKGPGVTNLNINLAGNQFGLTQNRAFTINSALPSDDMSASLNPGATITVNISGMTVGGAASGVGGGGGAVLNNTETVNLSLVHFLGNIAAGDGGAVLSTGAGTTNISQSSFFGNSSTGNGGAVAYVGANGKVENVTFSGNTADFGNDTIGNGGGISIGAGATVTLRASTLRGNVSADNGGGGLSVENSGSALVVGNIIFGNGAASKDIHVSALGSIDTTSGFNDIGTIGGTGTFAALSTGINGNISVNPMLGMPMQLTNGTTAFIPAAVVLISDKVPAA